MIDDGSTDGTEEFIEECKKNKNTDFRIEYHRKENGGRHTALNYFISLLRQNGSLIWTPMMNLQKMQLSF